MAGDDPTDPERSPDVGGSMTDRMQISRLDETGGIERKAGLRGVLAAVLDVHRAPVVVGRFEVRRTLGRGAMGVVYEAWDPQLEREVALKLVSLAKCGSGGSSDRSKTEVMLEEARMLARLSDPNVVTVHEAGEFEGEAYIAMELVKGADLDSLMQGTPPPSPAQILDFFLQAARGLAAAHRAGLVHRDFKPANVLVGDDGRVRVIDFGLARFASPNIVQGEGPFEVAGTWRYMSPEQARGENLDAKSDQYSFCIALWLALAPDTEPGDTSSESRLPPRIRRALLRGLREDPAQRWPSMSELAAALQPRRSWPIWIAATASVGMLSLVASLVAMPAPLELPNSEAYCPERPRVIRDAWGSEQRARIAAAYEVTGRTEAQTGFAHLADTLDSWVDAWQTARHGACLEVIENSGNRHLVDPGLAARARARLQCLDAAARDLAWFTQLIPTLDGAARRRVPLGLSTVRSPSECDDPSEYTSLGGERSQDVVAQVWRGEMNISLKRLGLAQEEFEAALEQAGAHAHRLRARIEADLATVSIEVGDFDQAKTWAERALASAEKAADPESMVRAWRAMGHVAIKQRQLEPARFALERTLNLRERLPAGSLLDGLVTLDEAELRFDEGEHARSAKLYLRAAEMLKASGGPEHAAAAHCDGINPLIELGEMERAAATSAACVELLAALYGDFHPSLAYPLAQTTNLHLIAGENERAMKWGERTVEVWRLSDDVAPDVRAQVFALVGGVAAELGDHDRSDALLEEALGLLATADAKAQQPSVANIMVRTQLGVSLTERERCKDALVHYDAVIRDFEGRTDAPPEQMMLLHMNRAECLAKTEQPEKALASLAEAWRISPHPTTSPLYGRSLRHDGEIRRLAGDLRGAREKLQAALDGAEAFGMSDADQAYTHYLLARTHADAGQRDRALEEIGHAEPLFAAAGDQNPERRDRFQSWVRTYVGGADE